MELLLWMGRTFARFVAVSVTILSGWIFLANAFQTPDWDWFLVWVLGAGLLGSLGGVLYLLSFDGPGRFRRAAYRIPAWAAMLAAVFLPTALTYMLVPLVLLLLPTLFTLRQREDETEEAATSV